MPKNRSNKLCMEIIDEERSKILIKFYFNNKRYCESVAIMKRMGDTVTAIKIFA